ncbi:MAG: TonB-dependent receptor [Gammaproteobacteria bacterium]|nr:TonB-dependent receptor [Gammaproteobacteria bacterium]
MNSPSVRATSPNPSTCPGYTPATSRLATAVCCRSSRQVIAILLASIAWLATGAVAQDDPGDSARRLEEVVVTAQKRQESLQDVPISMSVVSGEELTNLNIFDFTETAKLTPGVTFFPGVQTAAIRLRGVGPPWFALTSPQSVAVFIDQFAQGSVGAAFSTLVDVERLELLRGPQGTLYGQNAPGGAYNISTRAPNTSQLEGYLEGTYAQQNSASLDSTDLRGAINLPLLDDKIAVRLAGVSAVSDGYVKVRNARNPEDSTGGKDHKSLRSKLLWLVNERADLTWTVNYQDLYDNGVDFNVEGIVPGTGGANPLPAVENRFDDRYYYGDFLSEAQTDLLDTAVHLRWNAAVTHVDFLASWQDFDTYNLENRAPFPGSDSQFEIQLDWETVTAELRFSNNSDTFDYIAGLYYAKRDIDGFFDVTLSQVNLRGPAEGAGDIKAVFANFTYHLTEQWDITAGARYDKNDIWTISNFAFLGFNSIVDDDVSYDHLSWSFKLRHYFNEHLTGYLAIDNAYKQGGFNNLVPGLIPLAPLFPDIAAAGQEMLAFDEETSTAFEIGLKGATADGQLTYNLAVFYQEFDDHQIIQPLDVVALDTPLGDLNALFSNQLTNAEEVVTQGIEFDVTYLLAQNWDVNFRLAYFDATIEDWTFRFCPPGEESSPEQLLCPTGNGEPLNDLPQWNSNFQLGYTRPIGSTTVFSSRLSWSWQSSPNFTTSTDDFANAKSLFDLTIGIDSLSTGLGMRVWGKNLANEDLNVNPSIRTDGDPSLPPPFGGRYFPGRQYGMTVSYNF